MSLFYTYKKNENELDKATTLDTNVELALEMVAIFTFQHILPYLFPKTSTFVYTYWVLTLDPVVSSVRWLTNYDKYNSLESLIDQEQEMITKKALSAEPAYIVQHPGSCLHGYRIKTKDIQWSLCDRHAELKDVTESFMSVIAEIIDTYNSMMLFIVMGLPAKEEAIDYAVIGVLSASWSLFRYSTISKHVINKEQLLANEYVQQDLEHLYIVQHPGICAEGDFIEKEYTGKWLICKLAENSLCETGENC